MSNDRSLQLPRESGITRETVGVGGPSPIVSSVAEGGYSFVGGKTLQQKMVDIVSEHPMPLAASDSVYDEKFRPLSSCGFTSKNKRRTKIDLTTAYQEKKKIDLTTHVEKKLKERPRDIGLSQIEASHATNLKSKQDESLLPTSFGKKQHHFPVKRQKRWQIISGYSVGAVKTDSAKGIPLLESFDICLPEVARSSLSDSSLNEKNIEELIEMERSTKNTGQVLRQGMVLLKGYITLSEQVKIVKICRMLGIGPGGFYQPGYRDGAKLRLQMMCIGRDWDPQTRKYETHRAVDGSEPQAIPHVFRSLVQRAIQDSHALVGKHDEVCNVEDIIPDMSPNICIVNFYTNNGRLGLHQDRDESKESLDKGLPVVSFSIGDSAEFLYGDQRDVNKAEKLLLESGDVLIFGGKSRHIFHGVSSIISNSAPLDLVEGAKVRPGRLNLTFRQF
ncbi:hypothetical protein C3L33_22381, partial [Rhododendron williamsianum]